MFFVLIKEPIFSILIEKIKKKVLNKIILKNINFLKQSYLKLFFLILLFNRIQIFF